MPRATNRPRRSLASLCAMAIAAISNAPAQAQDIPATIHGTWSLDCASPTADSLHVDGSSITTVFSGKRREHYGVEVSYTWFGGAKATGDTFWLPTAQTPGTEFIFVIEARPGNDGYLMLDEGHPAKGKEFRAVFGKKFQNCSSTTPRATETRDEKPWIGRWGAPDCRDDATTIIIDEVTLDLSSMDMMCAIEEVSGDADTYALKLHCDSDYRTSMSVRATGQELEFVNQQQGFEFDPKHFVRC